MDDIFTFFSIYNPFFMRFLNDGLKNNVTLPRKNEELVIDYA